MSSKLTTASNPATKILQRKRRGRPPKGKKAETEASIGPTPLVLGTNDTPDFIQSSEKAMLLKLSSLLPSLQSKDNEVTDKTNDISVIDNIIRWEICVKCSEVSK